MIARREASLPLLAAASGVLVIEVALTAMHLVDHQRAVRVHDLANWNVSMVTQALALVTALLLLAHSVTPRDRLMGFVVAVFATSLLVESVRGFGGCSLAPLGLAFSGAPNLLVGWFAVSRRLRLRWVSRFLGAPLLVAALFAYVWLLMCL